MQDLFRVTPLDHIWSAQIRAQIRPNSANLFGHWKALGNHCLLAAIIFIRRISMVPFTQMFFSELGGLGQCRVGDDEVEVLWWRPDENVVPLLVTW